MGWLYGTTAAGGHNIRECAYVGVGGCGTVFLVSTGGFEKVLHSFSTKTKWPNGVIEVSGMLYGTTEGGGNGSARPPYGTFFRMSP